MRFPWFKHAYAHLNYVVFAHASYSLRHAALRRYVCVVCADICRHLVIHVGLCYSICFACYSVVSIAIGYFPTLNLLTNDWGNITTKKWMALLIYRNIKSQEYRGVANPAVAQKT